MGCFLGDPKGAPISSGRMTLLWSPESIHDLLALRAHINEHDPAAAKRVALHILYCVEYLLAENPKLGGCATSAIGTSRQFAAPRNSVAIGVTDGVIGRPSLWIAEDFGCCASG
jgi:plasmid stabilization system protein ParE